MFEFHRTKDYRAIREIITHPAIWPYVSDDFAPPVEQFQPIENDSIWYVLVKDGDQLMGMWMLVPNSPIWTEVHTCILPEGRGNRAREASILFIEWIWKNTPFLAVTTHVPSYNRLALNFAIRGGMKAVGMIPRSYQKNGHLMDQMVLGTYKPEMV